jgi:hypothetical protein
MHQLDETILKMYIRIYTVAEPGFQVRGTHFKNFTERREAQKRVGDYLDHGEVYSIQHYVIKCVSEL